MSDNILFSIIVPTYNRSEEVVKLVDLILKQEFKNFEILIIDDGSTDNTENKIRTLFSNEQKIRYIKQVNKERGAARNNGVHYSKGQYVNFFDSDDLMFANHLTVANDLIIELGSPEIFGLGYDCRSTDGKVLYNRVYSKGLNEGLIEGNHLSCNSVFVRKDIIVQNLFNEDRGLAAFEDWELWLRLAARYTIHASSVITSTIVNHDGRSVFEINSDKLILRGELLYKYLIKDQAFVEKNRKNIYKLKSSIFSYIALHLTLTKKNRWLSFVYFSKAFFINPKFLFKRRFLAIIKHFI